MVLTQHTCNRRDFTLDLLLSPPDVCMIYWQPMLATCHGPYLKPITSSP